MPISAQIQADADQIAANGGALDPDKVYFQFVCSTGDGQHDPEGTPDDKVRPAHACFHGTVWRLDDPGAPVPPLNYGCRCAMKIVGKPGTEAAKILDPAPSTPETNAKAPATRYLEEVAPKWEQVAKAAAEAPPAQAISTAMEVAKDLGYSRDIARMALDVRPPPPQTILGTGPLSGVGRAGRALVDRWRSGDLAAARELRKKYPATYARLLTEEPNLPAIE